MEDIYPLTLYREGGTFDWDGRPTDACTVDDAQAHSDALASGWFEALSYNAGPQVAAQHAPETVAAPVAHDDAWDALTDDELRLAASDAGINLHHKTGRAKLVEALRSHNHEVSNVR